MARYWDDPNDNYNQLYDRNGGDIFEGVTVQADTDILVLQRNGKILEFGKGRLFLVERINVEDGMVKVHPVGKKMTFKLDIRHFLAVQESEETDHARTE